MTRLAITAAAAAFCTLASSAGAAPLLLLEGSDTSVVVLDLGARDHTGDVRLAQIYRGEISQDGRPRTVTGEKRAFDCPARRQRLVARLARTPTGTTDETKIDAPWEPIAWKSALDFAAVAVCIDTYNKDKVSTKEDVPAMLASLEQVWEPGAYQPPNQRGTEPRRKRSWMRPF
jgi:hypothetical protein